jgi:hypothetical protein
LFSAAVTCSAKLFFLWFQKKGIYNCVRQHGKKPHIGYSAELEAIKNLHADLYNNVGSDRITERETN